MHRTNQPTVPHEASSSKRQHSSFMLNIVYIMRYANNIVVADDGRGLFGGSVGNITKLFGMFRKGTSEANQFRRSANRFQPLSGGDHASTNAFSCFCFWFYNFGFAPTWLALHGFVLLCHATSISLAMYVAIECNVTEQLQTSSDCTRSLPS